MPRTKEFERPEALEKALYLFWRQGYAHTSLSQLLEVMNLSRSSFYASFGDKRQLFIECLALYSEQSEDVVHSIEESDNPVEAIKTYIDFSFASSRNANIKDGCMLVNTVIELSDVDGALADIAAKKINRVERAFFHCFKQAVETGKFIYPSPKNLAQLFMNLNQGLRVSARKGVSITDIRNQVNAFTDLVSKYAT